ncbi:unnamed protein product [Scytosiphon promiscuus]
MNRASISLFGVVVAAIFLLSSGNDIDALLGRIDSLQTANAALQARLEACPSDEWIPAVGESWNYNLMPPVDTGVDVDVFMIDMDEEDSQDTIDLLHSLGKRVVCYISIGTAEEWRADFNDFPEDALGFEMVDWENEYWLDVNNEGLKPIMTARVEKAQSMNCDGIEPDNMDVYLQTDPGVSVTVAEQLDYNGWFASEVHAYGMKVGLKNCVELLESLVFSFDFAINEECNVYEECDGYSDTFLDQGKPVFNVEYTNDLDMCAYTNSLGMDTIVKDYELTAEFCSCVDPSRNLDCDQVI